MNLAMSYFFLITLKHFLLYSCIETLKIHMLKLSFITISVSTETICFVKLIYLFHILSQSLIYYCTVLQRNQNIRLTKYIRTQKLSHRQVNYPITRKNILDCTQSHFLIYIQIGARRAAIVKIRIFFQFRPENSLLPLLHTKHQMFSHVTQYLNLNNKEQGSIWL